VALFEAAVFDQFLIFDNWGILKNENPPKAGLGGAMKQLFQNFSWDALWALPPSEFLAACLLLLIAFFVILGLGLVVINNAWREAKEMITGRPD
jgi:hypothetical protein